MPAVPIEVILEQYQLRSMFFTKKLNELGFFGYMSKIEMIINSQGDTFDWSERNSLNISEDAWEKIQKSSVHPLFIFCHPKLLKQHPKLLRYYRSVVLLPQKGLQKISGLGSIKEIENGKREIKDERIGNVVQSLNALMSSIISLSDKINKDKISGMMYATAGTTIDGSWRNQIGAEGERVIRTVLVNSLIENNEIIAITNKTDHSFKIKEWKDKIGEPIETVNLMKSVVAKNGSTLLFSSEPDVTIINSKGETVGAMEIKAGIDPAGALERLGAMFKSFDSVLSVSPNAKTILVATCLTDEVESRLREANSVHQIYITTEIINNKAGKALKLANSVRGVMGLIDLRM
jgi:hypothetical protein